MKRVCQIFNFFKEKHFAKNVEAFLDAAQNAEQKTLARLLSTYGNKLINQKDRNGKTALMWAAYRGRTDIVNLLLENRANIEAKDNADWTALIWAAYEGRSDTVKLLLENGADIEAKNNTGMTAQMWANERGHSDIADILQQWPETLRQRQEERQHALEAETKEVLSGIKAPLQVSSKPLRLQRPSTASKVA